MHSSPLLGRGPRDWPKESKPARACRRHHPDMSAPKASDVDTTEGLDHRCPGSVRRSLRGGPDPSRGAGPWARELRQPPWALARFPGKWGVDAEWRGLSLSPRSMTVSRWLRFPPWKTKPEMGWSLSLSPSAKSRVLPADGLMVLHVCLSLSWQFRPQDAWFWDAGCLWLCD